MHISSIQDQTATRILGIENYDRLERAGSPLDLDQPVTHFENSEIVFTPMLKNCLHLKNVPEYL